MKIIILILCLLINVSCFAGQKAIIVQYDVSGWTGRWNVSELQSYLDKGWKVVSVAGTGATVASMNYLVIIESPINKVE